MVKVALKGVNTGFENPLPGEYKVVFTKYKEDVTDPEKPKFRAQFTIESPEASAGKMVFDNGSLQEHVLFGIKRLFAAFDPNHPALDSAKQFDTEAIAKDLIGKRADIVVTKGEPRNGRETINVSYVLASEKSSGWGR